MKLQFAATLLLSLIVWPLYAEVSATLVQASRPILSNPHDLKLSPDGSYLFVSDVGNNRIAILDPQTLELIDAFGEDHQSGTHDIDFDSMGRAYVADTHNNRVIIYSISDTNANQVGELSTGIRGPEGVLAHPNGRIYVAGAWSNNLVVFENGVVVDELRGLSSPHDLELAANGLDIWLADAGNDRILLLSSELAVKREWSGDTYNFDGVRYMDLLDDGSLVAADKNNHQIKFITPDGRLGLVLGDGKPGFGANKFTTPEGVEVRGTDLWLSDSGNDRILRYRLRLSP
ncbi:NHL repeat-containing protein [Candidatus Thiodiazotropha sp. CDECU1]|uniref:NHL repeat-containing protein n=1 Tax=Candidatus Thiodiazotropha sp. CDECU1 TaxID=3065865 RepID=UPI0029317097|nr:NHL repeat-containing protein [Candidatus Thiodiazotropha sp. CDECU1]